MTSDENRREVAARLRALPIDTYATIKEWEEGGLFIDADLSDEADYSQIHNAVFGCFPAEHMHPGDYEELHERLADLIDTTCRMEPEGEGFRCSACGTYHDMSGFEEFPWPHCPECGARVVKGR